MAADWFIVLLGVCILFGILVTAVLFRAEPGDRRKADITIPSAEGQLGYPEDMLTNEDPDEEWLRRKHIDEQNPRHE